MLDKKQLLQDAKLYLVLDAEVKKYDQLFEILQHAVESGVTIIQLRDKKGKPKDILAFAVRALEFLKTRKSLFVLNDYPDLAIVTQADGVHLGQDDFPVDEARRMLGDQMMIGASCQTLAQALQAQARGADYIGLGSVFKTLTKPDREPQDLQQLKDIIRQIKIPVFAIGGITLENVGRLVSLGFQRIAVTRSICCAKDIRATIKQFQGLLVR